MSWKTVPDVLQFLQNTIEIIKAQDPQLITKALKAVPQQQRRVARSILAPHTMQPKKIKKAKTVLPKKLKKKKRKTKKRYFITFYDANNASIGQKVLRKKNFKKYNFEDAPKLAVSYSVVFK